MKSISNSGFLPTGALITWIASICAYGVRVGAPTFFIDAGVALAAIAAVSLALRFHFRKSPGSFAIFFPAIGEHRGIPQSIRLMAALLIAYNVGALWVVLHDSFSAQTIQAMLGAGVISVMNLADECWIERRRRLAPTP